MPKTNDIAGTIRIPEAGYGRFWNFMKTMPGAEFTPLLDAKSEPNGAKRTKGKTSEGSTANCVVLAALTKEPLARHGIEAALVNAGKNKSSAGSALQDLKGKKHIRLTAKGWAITAAGKKFHATSCPA